MVVPFARAATLDWIISLAPFGRAGKRPRAVLRLLPKEAAIACEPRLALDRLPTRCIRDYRVDGVLL